MTWHILALFVKTWVIKCPHVSHHPTIRYMVYNGYFFRWAVSKRSCSSEGDKDMLTRPLAPCLRHQSFGLREGFCWICTYAELTLTGFCTPPQRQLTRSNFYMQNAMVLELCQASDAVEVDEDEEVRKDALFAQFPVGGAALLQRSLFLWEALWTQKRNVGLRGPYARLTRSLRGFPGSTSVQF